MSDHLLRVLQYLRVYGPCSVRALTIKMHGRWTKARRANRNRVYRACYELERLGLVGHIGEALWDVSEAGKVRFAAAGRQAELFGGDKC
jgi:hypothetical protein